MIALKDALQPGDAVVSKDSGRETALIRLLSQSSFSHVDVYVGEMFGEPMLVGTGPVFGGVCSKVRVVPLSTLKNDFVVMRPRDGGVEERLGIAEYVLSKSKFPYGFRECVPMAYRVMLQLCNRWFGSKFNVSAKEDSSGGWLSSELYAAGCNQMLVARGSGATAYFGMEPINVFPSQIAADTIRMKLVAERIDNSVHLLPE